MLNIDLESSLYYWVGGSHSQLLFFYKFSLSNPSYVDKLRMVKNE
jgi:hypothetical protein